MHGLAAYLGLFFAWCLSLENTADSYLCFRLALLHSGSYFFFPCRLPSSLLCTVFDSISSNMDEVISIKQKSKFCRNLVKILQKLQIKLSTLFLSQMRYEIKTFIKISLVQLSGGVIFPFIGVIKNQFLVYKIDTGVISKLMTLPILLICQRTSSL